MTPAEHFHAALESLPSATRRKLIRTWQLAVCDEIWAEWERIVGRNKKARQRIPVPLAHSTAAGHVPLTPVIPAGQAQLELLGTPPPINPPPVAIVKKSKNLPTSDTAKRIATLFRRKLTKEWDEKEVKALRKLMPIDPEELDLIGTYYAAERDKGKEGRHRRDMVTFLNNFRGEVDRAHEAAAAGKNGSNPL